MKNKYIIIVQTARGLYYVGRNYIGDYRAIDRLEPCYYEYGGRVTASNALTFDSFSSAAKYAAAERLRWLSDNYNIVQYNTCANMVILPKKEA